ncbi:hypothetical protein J8273_5389 [Carpediemonas membranifera]|uniref:Uncharacterized protein n=1 Tax=Carpediemonas membranifera TaxID=201153 RepID=A0A8J6B3U0_9EUKA|nr:hypothetical protein J8273_5389 [Carpediemonas membranifera]|eukprot:KAG9392399.1 hypothetical protein J8273_5389 [Carpediemonas membranifera]
MVTGSIRHRKALGHTVEEEKECSDIVQKRAILMLNTGISVSDVCRILEIDRKTIKAYMKEAHIPKTRKPVKKLHPLSASTTSLTNPALENYYSRRRRVYKAGLDDSMPVNCAPWVDLVRRVTIILTASWSYDTA